MASGVSEGGGIGQRGVAGSGLFVIFHSRDE